MKIHGHRFMGDYYHNDLDLLVLRRRRMKALRVFKRQAAKARRRITRRVAMEEVGLVNSMEGEW